MSEEDKWNELFLTGLRTKWGVTKEKIEGFGGLKKDEKELISNYIQVGLISETDTSWVLSLKGKVQADGIASSLFRLNKKN